VVASGKRLLIPLQPDTVMAWHLDERRELWRQTALPVRGRAVVDGEELFLATHDSRVVALSKGSGEIRWSRRLAGSLTPPVVTDDRVVVGSTADWVFALDRRSGRTAWDWPVWADVIGLAADRDRVYVIGLDNLVRALDRRNGNQHWKEAIGSRLQFAPLLDGDTLLVAARDPALHGFDLATGAARGTFSYPDHPELQITGAAPVRFPGPPSEAVRFVLFTRTEAIGLAPAPPPPDEPVKASPAATEAPKSG
jgi:outer membrane protein assembly factor BamB